MRAAIDARSGVIAFPIGPSPHESEGATDANHAARTKRGLRARVAAGGFAGGRCYGYDRVPGQPGELAINADEARTIIRIFELYAAGTTPRAIASLLNAEGIAAPRGGRWNASTINGSRTRQNGIIANALYAGEIIWNRQHFTTDPVTGKRVSRPNPAEDWVRIQKPELQIVDFDLYLRANALKARKGSDRPEHSRSPRHPLSGLIQCTCGAPFIVTGTNRLGCARHRESGDCDNATTLTMGEVERRVIALLEARLSDPDRIADEIRAAQAEQIQLARDATQRRQSDEARLAEVRIALERIVDRIVDGSAPQALVDRMQTFEAERLELEARLAEPRAQMPIRLHPTTIENFREAAHHLRARLAEPRTPAGVATLVEQFRELVDSVVIGQRPRGGAASLVVNTSADEPGGTDGTWAIARLV